MCLSLHTWVLIFSLQHNFPFFLIFDIILLIYWLCRQKKHCMRLFVQFCSPPHFAVSLQVHVALVGGWNKRLYRQNECELDVEKKVKSHYNSLIKLSAHSSFEVTPTHGDMSSAHIYLCKHGVPLVTRRCRPRTAHSIRQCDCSCV